MKTFKAQGTQTRYDYGSGDHLENVRKASGRLGTYLPYKRLCTSCNQMKSRTGGTRRIAGKLWKCADCIKARRSVVAA